MDAENVEIECPVCDQVIRADASRCPHCGAEFAMSGVDELERVAREMNGLPAIEEQRPDARQQERTPAAPAAVAAAGPEDGPGRDDKGFFGKLFRKRR